jgi:hypothetical protein
MRRLRKALGNGLVGLAFGVVVAGYFDLGTNTAQRAAAIVVLTLFGFAVASVPPLWPGLQQPPGGSSEERSDARADKPPEDHHRSTGPGGPAAN